MNTLLRVHPLTQRHADTTRTLSHTQRSTAHTMLCTENDDARHVLTTTALGTLIQHSAVTGLIIGGDVTAFKLKTKSHKAKCRKPLAS